MLSPRWRKVVRDLWLHRGRTLLVVLAIAVGLAGAGVILSAWAIVEVATRDGYLASNPASATIRVDSVTAPMLARVRGRDDVRDVQARRSTSARVQVAGSWYSAVLFTVEDFSAVTIGTLRPEFGAWPPDDDTFIVERSSLDFAGATVGEEVRFSWGNGPPVSLPLRGVVRDVGLAPGWMEHVVYGFVTRRTLERLGAPSSLDALQLVVRDPSLSHEDVRAIAYSIKRDLETMGVRVRDVDVPVPGEHIHAAQMDSLLYTQGAFALMALALSAFLVINLISAMLTGQVREIGIMKSIGAGRRQIATLYLAVAATLGVAAVTIAIPFALVAGRRYASLKADLLNFPIDGVAIPWWVVAIQAVVGIAIPVLAACIPVWRGCRISVNEALRDVGIAGNGGGESIVMRVGGLSRPMLLSLRNAFRRRQRMALTLLALATGGAVFLGASNLRTSVLGATDLIFAAQRFDFVLRLAEPQPVDAVERAVRAVTGVRDAEGWGGARGVVVHDDGTAGNTFGITAPPVATRLLDTVVDSGRWMRPGDGNVLVINRSLLRAEPTLAVGRTASVTIGGHTAQWTVVGLTETGTAPSAYAPREVVSAMAADGRVSSVMVASAYAGEGSTFDLIQRLRAILGEQGMEVSSSQLLAESRRVIEDHLLMVVDFLGSVAWLMLVVGGMGLASTMGLAVLERTREIGVLRAIGATHRSIFAVIQAEGVTIALMSWALAIPLSLPMSVALATAFGRIMLRVPVTYLPDGRGVVLWLAVVLIVSVLACAWPARRAMRVSTAAALAYE